jgi:hypothetical protein
MQPALSTMTLAEYEALTLEFFYSLPIDPSGSFVEGVIYDLVEIRNIERQMVPVTVLEAPGSESLFFEPYGQITLYPGRGIIVEEDRVDLAELEQIAKKGKISVRRFQQLVGHTTTGLTDISG